MLNRLRFGAGLGETSSTDLFEIMSRHSILARTDKAGRIVEVNDKFCELSGYSKSELIGNTHKIVNSGLQSSDFWDDVWATISSGQIWQGEICNRSKSGSLYWVESTLSPLFDANGKIMGYFAERTDVTRQKLASILVDAERAALNEISKGSGLSPACQCIVDGLSKLDPKMKVSVLSVTENRQLKHVAADGLSENYINAIDGVEIGPKVGSCGAAAYNGSPLIADDVSTHPNWLEFKDLADSEGLKACWSFPIVNAGGDVVGTVAAYYTETRLPSVYEEYLLGQAATTLSLAFKAKSDRQHLLDARLKAEEVAEARRLFISNMNHELRTPLNHILGFSDLLLYDPKYASDRTSIEPIKTAGIELLSKVEKAIEISASHKAVEKETFNLCQFFKSEIEPLLLVLNSHKRRDVSILPCPESIMASFARENLKHALKYVLENAFKFTDEKFGIIEVNIGIDFMAGVANIAIIDNGKGIDQEFVQKALVALEVEDPSFTRKHDGMGLGLTAAASLMRQSLGDLLLESKIGIGTTVTLRVPILRP